MNEGLVVRSINNSILNRRCQTAEQTTHDPAVVSDGQSTTGVKCVCVGVCWCVLVCVVVCWCVLVCVGVCVGVCCVCEVEVKEWREEGI